MPNQLAEGMVRVSYVEDSETINTLKLLALASNTNVSALIREATVGLLKGHDPKKQIHEAAAALAEEGDAIKKAQKLKKSLKK
jgi:hypothetical protein